MKVICLMSTYLLLFDDDVNKYFMFSHFEAETNCEKGDFENSIYILVVVVSSSFRSSIILCKCRQI